MRTKFTSIEIVLTLFLFIMSPMLYAQDEGADDRALDSLLRQPTEKPVEHLHIMTGSKYAQSIHEVPASVTIVTEEEIRRYGYTTLAEIMNSLRGFYTSYDRIYSFVGVRGFSRPTDYNNRILVQINGHTLNEDFYGSSFVDADLGIDVKSIDRIEIVRGPTSVLYGTGAMFSVINIIPKKGRQLGGGAVHLEYGSYEWKSASFCIGEQFTSDLDITLSGLWKDVKGHDLYFKEFDDPSTNNGIVSGLDWEKVAGLYTSLTWDRLSLQAGFVRREKGMASEPFDMVFNDPNASSLDQRLFFDARYEVPLTPASSLRLRLFGDVYRYDGKYPYLDSLGAVVIQTDRNNTRALGIEAQYLLDLDQVGFFTAGFEMKNVMKADYKNWVGQITYFDNNFPFVVYSVYAQDEVRLLDNLTALVGIRHDAYSETKLSHTSPRAALVYNPFEFTTLKLLYGNAFRHPTLYELYYQDSISLFKRNLSIQPEKIRSIEAIIEQSITPEVSALVSLYNYQMFDLIDPVIDPIDSMQFFQNVSEVRALGVEFEINARLASGEKGYVSISRQRANDKATESLITNSPLWTVKAGMSIPIQEYGYVSAEVRYEDARKTVYGTETNNAWLANLSITSRPLFEHLRLGFYVQNVFDAKYSHPAGYDYAQPAIEQDGRTFRVSLSASL